jgi:hypothetical protein
LWEEQHACLKNISNMEERGYALVSSPRVEAGWRLYLLFYSIHRRKLYKRRINLKPCKPYYIFVSARTKYPNPPKAQIQNPPEKQYPYQVEPFQIH